MGEARETSDRDRERIHVVASLGLPTLSLSTSPFLHPAMAVQAQYPSHAFFHNRNEMDTKNTEYGFLDSSPLFFPPHPPSGGNPNSNRKRGREEMAAPPATLNSAATTLIDLSLLHNQNPGVAPPSAAVSTGLRLSFDEHASNSFLSSMLTTDLAAEIKNQKTEIDQFLQSQTENLRRTLAETRRNHYRTLLAIAEQSAARRLREKELEMEITARRHAELEKRVAALRAETAAWQTKAKSEEAAAAALQAQLQNLVSGDNGSAGGGADFAGAEDAESCHIDPGRREVAARFCRSCRKRAAEVLVLPCRHLSLCRECVLAGAQSCPVCRCARSTFLDVFLS